MSWRLKHECHWRKTELQMQKKFKSITFLRKKTSFWFIILVACLQNMAPKWLRRKHNQIHMNFLLVRIIFSISFAILRIQLSYYKRNWGKKLNFFAPAMAFTSNTNYTWIWRNSFPSFKNWLVFIMIYFTDHLLGNLIETCLVQW